MKTVFRYNRKDLALITKKLVFFNKENWVNFLFFYLSIIVYLIFEIWLSSLNTSDIIQSLVILYNIIFIGYFYLYFNKRNFNRSSFITFFFFIKYVHVYFNILWSLAQISYFFDVNSTLINIGKIFNLDFVFLSFIISFLFDFLDYALLILFFKFIKLTFRWIPIYFSFEAEFSSFFRINIKLIFDYFSGASFRHILKIFVLFLVLIITPIAYSESMQTIHDTNDGLYYLTNALNTITIYFNKHPDFNGLFNGSNQLLSIVNVLFFAGKDLNLANLEFNSLNSPLYAPIKLLLGIQSETNVSLVILQKLSHFVGSTLLNLATSIENYLAYMHQVTQEILRRAYWWVLEADNITYNPKSDFYDKLNSPDALILINNINQFKIDFLYLKNLITSSYLKNLSIFNSFFSQMNKLIPILNQVIYLTNLAPPLLNATFSSIEVTNALAFDQFVTAKNLTDLAQKYMDQSQEILANYSFDASLSPAISEIGTVMEEFNYINHEFINMTYGTKNMFLNMSISIQDLNASSYSNNYFENNRTMINQNIQSSINYVQGVVSTNILKLHEFLTRKSTSLSFPFSSILGQFLWFYNGYNGAIRGYRSLWNTSEDTMQMFGKIKNQQNQTLNFIEKFNTTNPALDNGSYDNLLTNYTVLLSQLQSIGFEFNNSVTNGAIKTNTTIWGNLLGYSKSLNKFQDSGFYHYITNFTAFWINSRNLNNQTFTKNFNDFKTYSENFLNSLSASDIFISLSEELK